MMIQKRNTTPDIPVGRSRRLPSRLPVICYLAEVSAVEKYKDYKHNKF